jgi:hypothetical protein
MTNPAIRCLARAELRRSWLALVLLGLVAGLVGAVVVSSLAVGRRTGTAFDRLLHQSGIGDAIVLTMLDPFEEGDRLLELDGVEAGWSTTFSVARPAGEEETYLGVLSGPERPAGMLDLPIVAGRAPDPEDPTEVLLIERLAAPFGIRPGDEIPMTFLTQEEHTLWNTGFGEPDGPSMDLEVVGIVRSPVPPDTMAPLLATPAFHEQIAPRTGVGRNVFVQLTDGEAGIAAFERELRAFGTEARRPEGFEAFPLLSPVFPPRMSSSVDSTASVLVTGLVSLAATAALVGLLALAQAFARHHDTGSEDQAAERSLGLTTRQRALARTLPAGVAALVAALGTTAGGLAAGRIEPIGGLDTYEATTGFSPNLAIVLPGAAAAAAAVLLVAAGTAARAARRARSGPSAPRRSRVAELTSALGTSPVTAVGLQFALEVGRGRRAVPVRSAIMGVALAVGGVAATTVFVTSLDRLASQPLRWGGIADFSISDIDADEAADIRRDERLSDLALAHNAQAVVDGHDVTAYAVEPLLGDLSWSLVEGRVPVSDDELVLGTRLARRLDRGLGDRVALGSRGSTTSLEVVGIGLGPAHSGELLGDAALLSVAAQQRVALTSNYHALYVNVDDGVAVDAVISDYARRYEISPRERPLEVEDLLHVSSVPRALGGLLAVVGVAALANVLVLGVRRRRRSIAVLRAIGFTPSDARRAILIMATTCGVLGALAGATLGVAVGRVVWQTVAEGISVAADPLTPAWLPALVPAALLAAVAIAVVPAHRAATLQPSAQLNAE